MWFIPERTHLAKYLEQRKKYYPTMGFEAGLYMGSLNYSQEILEIKKVSDRLILSDDVGTGVNSWVDPFRDYVYKNFKKGKRSMLIRGNIDTDTNSRFFRCLQRRSQRHRV